MVNVKEKFIFHLVASLAQKNIKNKVGCESIFAARATAAKSIQ